MPARKMSGEKKSSQQQKMILPLAFGSDGALNNNGIAINMVLVGLATAVQQCDFNGGRRASLANIVAESRITAPSVLSMAA